MSKIKYITGIPKWYLQKEVDVVVSKGLVIIKSLMDGKFIINVNDIDYVEIENGKISINFYLNKIKKVIVLLTKEQSVELKKAILSQMLFVEENPEEKSPIDTQFVPLPKKEQTTNNIIKIIVAVVMAVIAIWILKTCLTEFNY